MTCHHCFAAITSGNPAQRYCSDKCRFAWHNAQQKGGGAGALGVMTQTEVARELGLTQQRVDQIERSALRKLRRLLDRRDFL